MSVKVRPRVSAADLFAGAGGTSTGFAQSCRELGYDVDLVAVNHWPVALASHARNHPWARHYAVNLQALDPREVVPSGRLDALLASPECTHHSTARGARPVNDQSRSSAWLVLRWLELLYVRTFLIENVPEFEQWGPVNAAGERLRSLKGETFKSYISALRSLGYTVAWDVLNSADYGDATSRKRLYIMGRRGRVPVRWPRATHSRGGRVPGTKPWRGAREVLDLHEPGPSIFSRKRPVALKTRERVVEGIRRFGGPTTVPFLPLLEAWARGEVEYHGLPTAPGAVVGGAFVLGQQSGGAPRSVDEPAPTVAGGGALSVAEPQAFVLPPLGFYARGGAANAPRTLDDPVQTLTSRGGGHVVEPFLVTTDRPATNRSLPRSVDAPVPTVVASNERVALAQAFLVGAGGPEWQGTPRSVDEAFPTLTTDPHLAVVQPAPYLVQYYSCDDGDGTRVARPVGLDEPIPTVPTHDRFGLALPVVNGVALDIKFRMLKPVELARAMVFGDEYAFTGTKTEIVKQIGNAVSVNMARALTRELLAPTSRGTLSSFDLDGEDTVATG